MDSMVVHAEARADAWDGAGLLDAAAAVAHAIKGTIGVTATVLAQPPGALERSIGKVKRVVDRRPRT